MATQDYVARIVHALRAADEATASDCFLSLLDDAEERQFAYRTLSRIVEGD